MSTPSLAEPPPRSVESLPGPRGWPWLGNALQVRPDRLHLRLEDWARQHGEAYTFRIRDRRFLVVSAPDVVQSVLRRRPEPFRRSRRLEQAARAFGFLGLFAAHGDTWRRQRPMVLAGLDPAHIRTFFPALVDVTQRLRRRWEKAAAAGSVIDVQGVLMRYTVDVTTGLAFGQDVNTLEKGEGEETIQAHLNVIMPALFRRILAPFDPPEWLRRLRDRELDQHLQALDVAVRGFIDRTRQQLEADPSLREHPLNLIQAMVAARDRTGSTVTDDDVSGNVLTMLLAGEDTTANTLAWMAWLLHRNPEAATAARAELDRVLAGGRAVTTMEQLAQLDFLEACANETMRLKPVGPLIINEATEDTAIGDIRVPRGGLVICLLRPAAVDGRTFPNPQAFDPWRWQGEAGAAHALSSAKRHSMPFGAGPRICPGRYLALTEIKLAAAMLLANFDLLDVSVEGGGEPQERIAIAMSPVGLRMRLRVRS